MRIFDASRKWSDPPLQHPLLPILARRIGGRPQATEPEIQNGFGGSFQNADVFFRLQLKNLRILWSADAAEMPLSFHATRTLSPDISNQGLNTGEILL
ncbi:MAG: hypothetical protein OXF74_11490 [Rhodobacteraceae bacterium]|nr:hypothetical protein [Paracoccaceae bacterium]